MSNRRKSGVRNSYTSGYLHSPAWFARRERWFKTEARIAHLVVCVACERAESPRKLELHHLDYAGIHALPGGRWHAAERHEDLIPMHPHCHELLHRLIERDVVLARHRTRRDASLLGLQRLRAKLAVREESR